MRLSSLRKLKQLRRISAAAVLSLGGLITLLGVTTGVASAVTCPTGYSTSGSSNLCIPNYPTTGVYPNWLTAGTGSNDTQSASNIDRAAGSDTTLYMMQDIGDLFNDAGLYGCNLLSTNNADCQNDEGTAIEADSATTDTADNFDRTEITNGINNIGSGNGLKQLCGTQAHTSTTVQFARSSKPAVGAVSGCAIAQAGYAKDSVPAVDFQTLSPGVFGTPSYFSTGAGNGQDGTAWPTANSGKIGAPAAGWLPGNPDNCVPAGSGLTGTACTGTPFTDVDNTPITPGDTNSSIAYRLWCASNLTGTDSRIDDWGQLTNLSASGPGNGGVAKTIGNGAPIGVPIHIVGINTGSGTVATFSSFANSDSTSTPGCLGSSDMDVNAAQGADFITPVGTSGNLEIAVENNAAYISNYASADFPNDPADQAVADATSLYAESYGVYESNPNAGQTTLLPGTGSVPAGVPLSYTETPLNENGVAPSIAHERTGTYPTARTLFNAYLPASVNASVGGFINWICDENHFFQKETDLTSGANYDSEITNIINNDFEYSRLNDDLTELANTTPGDFFAGASTNAACDASMSVTGDGADDVVTNATSTAPLGPDVPSPQAFAVGQVVDSTTAGWPAGVTTVAATPTSGSTTITLTNSGGNPIPSGTYNVYFPGMPPVLAVANANS